MKSAGQRVRKELGELGVRVGGGRKNWLAMVGATALCESFPCMATDRDIVAVHFKRKHLLVAEVEGESSGQPEQKLYKAIGQLVLAVSAKPESECRAAYILVVHGDAIATHLGRASILKQLKISALHLARERKNDQWLFWTALLPKLLSGELRLPAQMLRPAGVPAADRLTEARARARSTFLELPTLRTPGVSPLVWRNAVR